MFNFQLYGKNERVTVGYDYDHRNCKRKVESVEPDSAYYSGYKAVVSPCVECAQPSIINNPIDMNWLRRG